jgi:hypothetical protein
MKKKLLIPILMFQVLQAQAYVATPQMENLNSQLDKTLDTLNQNLQALCADEKNVDIEKAQKESNYIWKQIVNQINTAKINYGKDLDVSPITNTSLSIGKISGSEPSIGGKFSGIDRWNIGLSALVFGSEAADLGLSGRREVTFIQQFNSRCKSLVRLAYDPITKIPLTANRAIHRLNPGDFVAFSAPLTLSLGKGVALADTIQKNLTGSASLSVYASGEIDIHIFRMNDNFVRVRFFANKSKGISISVGLKFVAIPRMLTATPVELSATASNSNLFTADYIFNLNNEESRNLYDQVMGEKFKSIRVPIPEIFPFASAEKAKDTLYADLGKIDDISFADSNLELKDRRVIRLGKGENDTNSFSRGLGINIFELVKAKITSTRSDSDVSQYNVENNQKYYKIKSMSHQNEYGIFKYWGQEDTYNTAFLAEADEKYNPTAAKGLQSIRVKQQIQFTKSEINSLKSQLTKTLPEAISSRLVLPDVEKLSKNISNTRIEQSLFIDAQIFDEDNVINTDNIRIELANIIKTWGKINSNPYNAQSTSNDMKDPIIEAKKAGDNKYYWEKDGSADYMEAFAGELYIIPNLLSKLFDNKVSINEKLKTYDSLQYIDLFNEVGSTLLLRVIAQQPKNLLEKAVTYRLVITGKGIEPKITEFPENPDLSSSRLFQRILNENSFLTDRSFNLKYFLNDKGEALSLLEAYDQSK